MPMPYIYRIRQEQGLRRYLPPYSLFPYNAPKLLKQITTNHTARTQKYSRLQGPVHGRVRYSQRRIHAAVSQDGTQLHLDRDVWHPILVGSRDAAAATAVTKHGRHGVVILPVLGQVDARDGAVHAVRADGDAQCGEERVESHRQLVLIEEKLGDHVGRGDHHLDRGVWGMGAEACEGGVR